MKLHLNSSISLLCKFSGEDYTIIQECDRKIQSYFALIGLLVLVILSCSFASALYFTDKLFHSWVLDIGVGIIWGYIVTNMYVLFLYTISPTLLPTKSKHSIRTSKFQLSLSMGLRIFIVVLLAIIIAQPLCVLILRTESTNLAYDIKQLLSNNPLASIITLLVICIFLLPVYFKYSIRKLGSFYSKKAEIEKNIIEDNYTSFKIDYQKVLERNISIYNRNVKNNLERLILLLEKVNSEKYSELLPSVDAELKEVSISKYEYWANPPYRTIAKLKKANLHSEQDLLKQIYPEDNC